MKSKVIDFKKKQERLLNRKSKVYITDHTPKSLADILASILVRSYATHSVNDKGVKRKHCSDARSRSVEDCFLVARTYFPNISYKTVHEAVKKLRNKHIVNASYCCTTGRVVHSGFVPRVSALDKVEEALGSLNLEIYESKQSKLKRAN